MHSESPSMVGPTLMAGGMFGVLAGLPGLHILNVCTCCSMVVACGFVAAYLTSKDARSRGVEFSAGRGAAAGLIAGLIYAVVVTVVSTVSKLVVGQPFAIALLEWLQGLPDLPAENADMIDDVLYELEEKRFGIFEFIVSAIQSLFTGVIFSTVGGLIGGAVFKTAAPVPAPPVQAPPPIE